MSTKTTLHCSNMDATWLSKHRHQANCYCKLVYQSCSRLAWSLPFWAMRPSRSFLHLKLMLSPSEPILIIQILRRWSSSRKTSLHQQRMWMRPTTEFLVLLISKPICKTFVMPLHTRSSLSSASLLQTSNLLVVQPLTCLWQCVVRFNQQFAQRADHRCLKSHSLFATNRE